MPRTSPSTVAPCSITALWRLATSPPTWAPERTVTRPLNAITLSSTVPVTSASPLKTTRLSVTVPWIVASPLKITAVATVSPSGTTSVPDSTISSSPLDRTSCAKAGAADPNPTAASTAAANTTLRRRRRLPLSMQASYPDGFEARPPPRPRVRPPRPPPPRAGRGAIRSARPRRSAGRARSGRPRGPSSCSRGRAAAPPGRRACARSRRGACACRRYPASAPPWKVLRPTHPVGVCGTPSTLCARTPGRSLVEDLSGATREHLAYYPRPRRDMRSRARSRVPGHGGDVQDRPRIWLLAVLLAIPVAGLVLLLAVPDLDVQWEHHPSHFLLVLGVALLNVGLAVLASDAAHRRDDARLFLVSVALIVSSGFLGLHALATPGVFLDHPNSGFTIATPIGLLLASAFAASSAIELGPEAADAILRRRMLILGILAAVLVGWAIASLAKLNVLNQPLEEEGSPFYTFLAPFGVALYAFAAWRYLGIYRARSRTLPLSVAVAFVLLAEALIAVAFARSWHASWWEWHVLMAIAFAIVMVAIRNEYRHEGSVAGAFGGLYLEQTLDRLDRRTSEALSQLAPAMQ